MKGSFEISIYALLPKAATVMLPFLILKRTVLTPKMHLTGLGRFLTPKMHLLVPKMHLRAGTLTGLGRFRQDRSSPTLLPTSGSIRVPQTP